MIGRLTGALLEKQAPELLIDVNGVGYELQAPMTTFYRLGEAGKNVTLHTHLSVSETSQQLFGFISKKDRELFRLLIKVSGVGPKMALSIMAMESEDFVRCVMQDNVGALVKVPGVGKKTAERLIIEMRDRLKKWSPQGEMDDADMSTGAVQPVFSSASKVLEDAESALVALGYKPAEAAKALAKIPVDDASRSEDLIRAALKSMIPS